MTDSDQHNQTFERLHVMPGPSAAASLRKALSIAGRDDRVAAYPDNLSCGPVVAYTTEARAAWWQQFIDWPTFAQKCREFWSLIDTSNATIVLWFGRHSALELAFRLFWAWRMEQRPYQVVEFNAKEPVRFPAVASLASSEALAALYGTEIPVSPDEEAENRRQWCRLMAENAPFRVVTPAGLVSAPLNYFDALLLEQATPNWQDMKAVVGRALVAGAEPYFQTGDLMLLARIAALVGQGRLEADGDPWDMANCKVRLSGGCP